MAKIGRKLTCPPLCKIYQPWGNLYRNSTTCVLGKFGYIISTTRSCTYLSQETEESCGFQTRSHFGYLTKDKYFLLHICSKGTMKVWRHCSFLHGNVISSCRPSSWNTGANDAKHGICRSIHGHYTWIIETVGTLNPTDTQGPHEYYVY